MLLPPGLHLLKSALLVPYAFIPWSAWALMEWKGHKQAPSSFPEPVLQPRSQLMPPFIELCPHTARREQPPTVVAKHAGSLLQICSQNPLRHGCLQPAALCPCPVHMELPFAEHRWVLGTKHFKLPWGLFPPCAQEQDLTRSPAGLEAGSPQLAPLPASCTIYGSHLAPRGFNLVLQKAQNTFPPPWFCLDLVSGCLTNWLTRSSWASGLILRNPQKWSGRRTGPPHPEILY